MDVLNYIIDNQDKYMKLLTEHLRIIFVALIISFTIGIFIGFLVYNSKWLSSFFTNITSSFRVIPSLVFMLIFMPLLGIGKLPAIIALTLIGLPAILTSTIQGLSETPAELIESAAACAMTKKQIFWKLRLPLALPTIVTGMRISSLSISAGATLTAYIGAGGLGEFILSGLSQYRMDILLSGAITVMIICVLLELFFELIYIAVIKYTKHGGS